MDKRRTENKCENWGDESIDDVSLNGYQTCVLRFTKQEYDLAPNNEIDLYVNHPTDMLSWIETCWTNTPERKCVYETLDPGLNYILVWHEDYNVSFLFENQTPEEQIFQLEYTTAFRSTILSAGASYLVLSAGLAAYLIGLLA